MSEKIRHKKLRLLLRSALWAFAAFATFARPGLAADIRELEAANAKGQWSDAAEISYELLLKDPGSTLARLQGSYALFQKGYSNSALLWLRPLSPKDWKSFPQGEDRFAEIISLFQKKVPLTLLPGRLDQIGFDDTSPYLHDELRFAKGRQAFEKRDETGLKKYLPEISKGSRYSAEAHYLLGASAVQVSDYKTAVAEFSKVFEPEVLDQSTEFWRDMGTQMTTHWGASLRIALDAQSVRDSEKVGELALLGLARSAYASGQFEPALAYYSRVQRTSIYYPRATLEKIWTLLALNRHEDAQRAAADLSVNDQTFQSLEARTLRALILTDVGRTDEARAELSSFERAYRGAKASLQSYETTHVDTTLPAFIKADVASDIRLRTITEYRNTLIQETEALRKEDMVLFPVYAEIAGRLEPLVLEAKGSIYKIIQEHVERRRADLEALYVQSRLILAETDLEDREKLRVEFKNLAQTDTAKQAEHDRRLVALLQNAVETVDGILPQVAKNKTRLEFRQSELLWELSTARGIVAQTTHDKAEQVLSDQLRERSLRIAEEITARHPEFERHAQAMFFTGYAQIEIGRTGEGTRTLERYVKIHPKDAHVPDAYRILADLKFDDNHFGDAEALYQRILDFPDSAVVGYAFYKIAWCAYNRKDFARALLGLEKAVRWAGGNSQSQLLSLKTESHHDLISLYAEVGDSRKAFDYFSRFFEGDTTVWLGDLASELDRIGQFEKSADLYRTLVALEPASADNVRRQAEVINGQYRLHHWASVVEETRKLVRDYKTQLEVPQPEEQAAAATPGMASPLPASPAATAEKILREAVLTQLFEYQKDPSPESESRVMELDELYLSAFGHWPLSQTPLYRHAQFLLAQNKIGAAVDVFHKHWVQFKDTLKEPVREEALRNLVYALDKSPGKSPDKPDDKSPEKPDDNSGDITKTGPELLQFTEEYGKEYPKTKYARSVRFLRSTVFFKLGRSEEGTQASQALFDENAADDIGKRAFKNLRVAYYDLKNWERTYRWADKELASQGVGVKLYEDELKTVRMEALFQWADQTQADAKSAGLFLQLARDPDMKRLSEKAMFNAFVRYHKAGDDVRALDVASELEKEFPDFDGLSEISGTRAELYQEAGDYARAYPLLKRFVEERGKTVLKAKMNLALIAEALGKNEEAGRRYEEFLKEATEKEAPQVEEAKRALQRLAPKKPAAPELWSGWGRLEKARADFEKRPLPEEGDLASRIKKGGESLERVAQEFAGASTASSTPVYFAFESYCSLPELYAAYGKAVSGLADEDSDLKSSERQELRIELSKVTDPLQGKIHALADQCLARSAESLHDGQAFRKVLERWGWMSDPGLKARADGILAGLKKGYPWLDPVPAAVPLTESAILESHLRHQGSEDSWYALARVRWNANHRALSRLTLVDGLILNPGSGKILNALAAIDEDAQAYEQASQKGSAAAWADLAYLHLESGRLTQAERALEQGLAKDSFNADPELKKRVMELDGELDGELKKEPVKK